MKKLDWFPLYIHRIKGSETWKRMRDYQRGQYMSLLLELADAPRVGYLPNDVDGLAVLAGAEHMRRAFSCAWREGGIVRACFKTRIIDGIEWIYNERLLEVIEHQLQKTKGGRPRNETPLISLSDGLVLSIYKDYPRKENRRKSLEEIAKAIKRYAQSEGIEELEAAEFIHKATIEFRDSDAAKAVAPDGRSLCPYPSTWYHNDRFLDDRSQWGIRKLESSVSGPKQEPQTERVCRTCKARFQGTSELYCSDECFNNRLKKAQKAGL